MQGFTECTKGTVTMAQNEHDGQPNGNGPSAPLGVFIRGVYLGVQESRTFKRNGTDELVTVKPKVGIDVGEGHELEIKCKDNDQLARVRAGMVKGDLVELAVEVRPPYGSRGDVDFFAPGAIESFTREWK